MSNTAAESTLAEQIDRLAVPGTLYARLDKDAVRCLACAHRCLIHDGRRGICQVRFTAGGTLYVPHGYVAGLHSDPIEKKPFFHVYPGTKALTFGMLGCDLHCSFCQNWLTTQALRDPEAGIAPTAISAQEIIAMGQRAGARAVISSYNEPLITSEWAVEVFQQARPAGLICGFVSNGNATPEVLDYLRPWADCYKIDLKTMSDRNYRQLGGVLDNILEGIRMAHARGFWVEVVTLVVPGFNDSDDELHQAAEFIASVSADIPWHVTAFHPDYKMTGPGHTSLQTLLRAARIGQEAGLHYVYIGNQPGRVAEFENTYCHVCHELLVERSGYHIRSYGITSEGTCPRCQARIPGIWDTMAPHE